MNGYPLHYELTVNWHSRINQSGKEEHRPKAILVKIATAHGRAANTDFRTAVAERTEIEKLENECPKGFKPFAQEVRRAFGETA